MSAASTDDSVSARGCWTEAGRDGFIQVQKSGAPISGPLVRPRLPKQGERKSTVGIAAATLLWKRPSARGGRAGFQVRFGDSRRHLACRTQGRSWRLERRCCPFTMRPRVLSARVVATDRQPPVRSERSRTRCWGALRQNQRPRRSMVRRRSVGRGERPFDPRSGAASASIDLSCVRRVEALKLEIRSAR